MLTDIPSAGLARHERYYREQLWLEGARNQARVQIADRVETLELLARKLGKETPYPLRFWWRRLLTRMARGELGVPAYDAELRDMRALHREGKRYAISAEDRA